MIDYTVEKRPTSWHVERALQFIAECRADEAPCECSAENGSVDQELELAEVMS